MYFYSSGQPFTHGGDAAAKAWGNNTGIRRLTLRRDGFVAVEAPYIFASSPARRAVELPLLTTVALLVPSNCAPPQISTSSKGTSPAPSRALTSARARSDPLPHEAAAPPAVLQRVSGGAQLHVNFESSVAGSVTLELRDAAGAVLPGFDLASSDALKGSAVRATASWNGGANASLSSLAGQRVAITAALSDAKLFSLRIRCAAP